MRNKKVLEQIKNKLVVSCQARVGWAMYGSNIMACFAKAAEEGGAAGIRATGVDNIRSIKEKVNLPIIGINKQWIEGCDVYITPTYESAKEILDEGIEIIAIDATSRKRPNEETFESIILNIRKNYPDVLIMGEISTIEEAKNIIHSDIDLISTTLSGYTQESKHVKSVNLNLVSEISKITNIPVVCEGKINTYEDAIKAYKAGAFSVVVGTAITRPEIITKRFVDEINKSFDK
ncbi:MAG: N-acetylmannosamine-6-phosphate 2-epimerase [Peptostreptococcaceae bacterium]